MTNPLNCEHEFRTPLKDNIKRNEDNRYGLYCKICEELIFIPHDDFKEMVAKDLNTWNNLD